MGMSCGTSSAAFISTRGRQGYYLSDYGKYEHDCEALQCENKRCCRSSLLCRLGRSVAMACDNSCYLQVIYESMYASVLVRNNSKGQLANAVL
jgi:hypothetical protein